MCYLFSLSPEILHQIEPRTQEKWGRMRKGMNMQRRGQSQITGELRARPTKHFCPPSPGGLL